jgi:hypothetical protein
VIHVNVEVRVFDGKVGEAVASHLEQNAARIPVLISAPEEERVVLGRLMIDPDVLTVPVARLRHELLEHPVPVAEHPLIGQRVEETHDVPCSLVDPIGGNHLVGKRVAGVRILGLNRRPAEIAVPHRFGRHVDARAAVDRLVVRSLVVGVEEQLVLDERAAHAAAPAMLVRV